MEYTIERFGKYTVILTPVIDRGGARISERESVLDVPWQEVMTKATPR